MELILEILIAVILGIWFNVLDEKIESIQNREKNLKSKIDKLNRLAFEENEKLKKYNSSLEEKLIEMAQEKTRDPVKVAKEEQEKAYRFTQNHRENQKGFGRPNNDNGI